MMDFLNNFIFIFLLSGMERRVLSSNLDVEFCGVSKLTRVVVKKCPTDEEGWKTASKQKDCSSYQDKCSGNLTYHCVINPWQNLTVEVCAPPTRIRAGHCAEYNTRGGKIQEYYLQNCRACLNDYMSTEAYKYQECYSPVLRMYNNQQTGQQAQKQYRDISVGSSLTCSKIKYYVLLVIILFMKYI
ncbi:uncharacterized protein LOC134263172 isoform X4 [Saccostrea cucullata]|uniref:uncharacterized protein LOC134263172 isoform X4 n=1 Tax=Saccostrea cuccullata TaxID=36930 RepID=UPI002ED59696